MAKTIWPLYAADWMPGSESEARFSNRGQLERWWREHSELDQRVEELVAATGRNSAAASEALEELALVLEGHLSVEEDVYFPLVETLRPDLSQDLRQARLAHVMVRGLLDQIRSQLALGDCGAARAVLGQLLETFRVHEEREGQLVADLSATVDRA